MRGVTLGVVVLLVSSVVGQWEPHMKDGRTTMVHLFEWRWNDIAEECERFLGPYGYGGIQISPPSENRIVDEGGIVRPWYERYQPVSYKLDSTRSGNEEEFKSMVNRCNNAGVRIYVDTIINHMAGGGGDGAYGTGGSFYNYNALQFDGVPYSALDFNGRDKCPSSSGGIEDYSNVLQVRNCRLVGLSDLDQGKDYTRQKIVEYMNKLISYGVAGFRVDAAKHMWPGDLDYMFKQLNDLSTAHGFPAGSRPFIGMEVIDLGGEAVGASEYLHIGRVTEFKLSTQIGYVFRRQNGQKLSYLKNWGEGWGFMAGGSAFVFVDNHDNQRGHGAGGESILSHKVPRLYKMAQAFTLAWPYGVPRVMSSFAWSLDWQGPPHDGNYNTLPISINPDLTCNDGWMCEHRWRQIYNMAKFRNVVGGEPVANWWDNGNNQIAFSRGSKGFLAINNDDSPMNANVPTGVPNGTYCDLITGNFENGQCTGKTVTVSGGSVQVSISNSDEDPMIAIHVEAKL